MTYYQSFWWDSEEPKSFEKWGIICFLNRIKAFIIVNLEIHQRLEKNRLHSSLGRSLVIKSPEDCGKVKLDWNIEFLK